MGCFVQVVKFVCDVLSTVAEMAWDVCPGCKICV